MFKKRRGVKLSYNKQGLIYFVCMNLNEMPEEIQQKVTILCKEVAGEHSDALFSLLTDDSRNIHGVSMKFHLSETQLYVYRKKFYEQWGNP